MEPKPNAPASEKRQTTQRRLVIGVVVLVLLTVGVAGWWSASGSRWTCESAANASTCLASSRLDVASLGVASPSIIGQSFDVSADGVTVAVGVSDQEERTAIIGLFDSQTGSIVSTLSADGEVLSGLIEHVSFSPDGSLLAVLTNQTSGYEIAVFEIATGNRFSTVPEISPFACPTLGFSPDNAELQCGFDLFGTATGQLLRTASAPFYADFAVSGLVMSRDGTTAEEWDHRDGVPLVQFGTFDTFGDSSRDFFMEYVLAGQARTDDRDLSFHPTGSHLLAATIESRDDRDADTTVSVYEFTSGALVFSESVGFDRSRTAWNDQGHFAVLSSDDEVVVFDFTEL